MQTHGITSRSVFETSAAATGSSAASGSASGSDLFFEMLSRRSDSLTRVAEIPERLAAPRAALAAAPARERAPLRESQDREPARAPRDDHDEEGEPSPLKAKKIEEPARRQPARKTAERKDAPARHDRKVGDADQETGGPDRCENETAAETAEAAEAGEAEAGAEEQPEGQGAEEPGRTAGAEPSVAAPAADKENASLGTGRIKEALEPTPQAAVDPNATIQAVAAQTAAATAAPAAAPAAAESKAAPQGNGQAKAPVQAAGQRKVPLQAQTQAQAPTQGKAAIPPAAQGKAGAEGAGPLKGAEAIATPAAGPAGKAPAGAAKTEAGAPRLMEILTRDESGAAAEGDAAGQPGTDGGSRHGDTPGNPQGKIALEGVKLENAGKPGANAALAAANDFAQMLAGQAKAAPGAEAAAAGGGQNGLDGLSGTAAKEATPAGAGQSAATSSDPALQAPLASADPGRGTDAADFASHLTATRSPRPGQPLGATDQVAVRLQKGVQDGDDKITMQLRPEELGRIDIKLEIAKDGAVSAMILADRPQTLDLLQRDQRSLERALQNAGLNTDSGSLSFGLRGEGRNSTSGNGEPRNGQGSGRGRGGAKAAAEDPSQVQTILRRMSPGTGRVDVRI
jgi:flagellar hook-length control protein FliK